MTQREDDMLSAYLDGELSDMESRNVEARLDAEPDLRAKLDAMLSFEAEIKAGFDDMLAAPVDPELKQKIADMEPPAQAVANIPTRPSRLAPLAAAIALFAIGLGGGYGLGLRNAPAPMQAGWLQDVASYHAIYASQGRHLVEVAASEADHIEAWLGKTVGVPFETPDLSAAGWTYQGARLLAAAGKPVAQLIYTDAAGTVMALCMIASDKPPSDGVNRTDLNGFQMVSWTGEKGGYVIIAPQDQSGIETLAETVRLEV